MKKSIIAVILLIAAVMFVSACKDDKSPYIPDMYDVPVPTMAWNVHADFDILTPYDPGAMYTRLHAGAMPELIASDDYGLILPYISGNILADGSMGRLKYGFVTIDGIIITDLVFDLIERSYTYHWEYIYQMAYKLSISTPGDNDIWYMQSKYAACAADGSWVTPFEYVEIIFSNNYIFLIRDYETADIDIYDYDGNFLRNMLENEWVKYITENIWAADIVYSVYDGSGWVTVQSPYGNLAYVDIMTGEATYAQSADYYYVNNFSEGLAGIWVTGDDDRGSMLWGYINEDFEYVIEPKYMQAGDFLDGKALVSTQDGTFHLINKQEEILFTFEEDRYVGIMNYDMGYVVYPRVEGEFTKYYTNDLIEIKMPDRLYEIAFNPYVYELNNGWLALNDYSFGVYLFRHNEEHFFPGIDNISFTDGYYMIVQTIDDDGYYRSGVTTFDGREIIPIEEKISITRILGDAGVKAFIVNDEPQWGIWQSGGASTNTYTPNKYRLIDLNGNVLASGSGRLIYDDISQLYYVLSPDYFAWLNSEGKTIINIPLMSYMLD